LGLVRLKSAPANNMAIIFLIIFYLVYIYLFSFIFRDRSSRTDLEIKTKEHLKWFMGNYNKSLREVEFNKKKDILGLNNDD